MEPTIRHAGVAYQTGHRASLVAVTIPLPVDLPPEQTKLVGPPGLMEFTEFLGEAVRHPDDHDDPQVAYLLALGRALQAAANAATRRAQGRIRMNDHNQAHSKRAKQLAAEKEAKLAEEIAKVVAELAADLDAKEKKRTNRTAPPRLRCNGKVVSGKRCKQRGGLVVDGKRYCKRHAPEPEVEVEATEPEVEAETEIADLFTELDEGDATEVEEKWTIRNNSSEPPEPEEGEA